jgi:hypothetical protein
MISSEIRFLPTSSPLASLAFSSSRQMSFESFADVGDLFEHLFADRLDQSVEPRPHVLRELDLEYLAGLAQLRVVASQDPLAVDLHVSFQFR